MNAYYHNGLQSGQRVYYRVVATTGSGEFAGGTKILSQTLGGLLSTLRDNVNIAFAEFGQAIAEAFNLSENIPKISAFIGDLVKKFKDLEPSTQRVLVVFTGLTAVAGPLLIVIGKLAMGISGAIRVAKLARTAFIALTTAMRANPFVLVATAIAGVVLALKNLKSASAIRLDEFQKSIENISTEDAQKKLQELTDKLKENKIAEEELAKVKSGRKKGTMVRDLKDENLELYDLNIVNFPNISKIEVFIYSVEDVNIDITTRLNRQLNRLVQDL